MISSFTASTEDGGDGQVMEGQGWDVSVMLLDFFNAAFVVYLYPFPFVIGPRLWIAYNKQLASKDKVNARNTKHQDECKESVDLTVHSQTS